MILLFQNSFFLFQRFYVFSLMKFYSVTHYKFLPRLVFSFQLIELNAAAVPSFPHQHGRGRCYLMRHRREESQGKQTLIWALKDAQEFSRWRSSFQLRHQPQRDERPTVFRIDHQHSAVEWTNKRHLQSFIMFVM